MSWKYIAGFFDGEGSIARNGRGFRITIPQTNLLVLKRIKAFTRVGTICKVTKREMHWKDSWTYYIASQEDVLLFLKNVLPFVIVKHLVVSRVLPKINVLVRLQREKKERLILRISKALQLRKKGLSYWRIGLKMNLDRGYVRRLVLGRW